MDQKKLDILKRIQEMRDNGILPDYETLEREGFERGVIRSLISDRLITWAGTFSLTIDGDKVLRDYLILAAQHQKEPSEKYIFDSNVFDDLISGKLDVEKINLYKSAKNVEFYITHVQSDELNRCKSDEKRAQLFLAVISLRPIVLPTSSFVWGKSRFGLARMSDGKDFEELRLGNAKHTDDALIGETAVKHKITLVTNDRGLRQRIVSAGGDAISVEEFQKRISRHSCQPHALP